MRGSPPRGSGSVPRFHEGTYKKRRDAEEETDEGGLFAPSSLRLCVSAFHQAKLSHYPPGASGASKRRAGKHHASSIASPAQIGLIAIRNPTGKLYGQRKQQSQKGNQETQEGETEGSSRDPQGRLISSRKAVQATPADAHQPATSPQLETNILLPAGCRRGWPGTGRDGIRLCRARIVRDCAHHPMQRECENDDGENLARENQRAPVIHPAATRADHGGLRKILSTLAALDEISAR